MDTDVESKLGDILTESQEAIGHEQSAVSTSEGASAGL